MPDTRSPCRFSVVVPTYNRPGPLRNCLTALAALDYPKDRFEIVLVDDGSPRPVNPAGFPSCDRLRVRLLRTPNRGPAHARNVGVSAAKGRWIAFTDDDCRVDPAWLRHLEEALRRYPNGIIGGRTVNLLGGNPFSSASQMILDMAYAFYNRKPEEARFFSSNNMAVDRALFEAEGGFDPAFTLASEDRDLCDRWRHAGRRMVYRPRALVGHAHPLSPAGFARLHFRYGRGACRYQRIRRRRRSGKAASDVTFHMSIPRLLGARLEGVGSIRAGGLIALLGVWEMINLAGFLYESTIAGREGGAGCPWR